MVYCTKCGTKNEEDAAVCIKCGASLGTGPPSRRGRKRMDDECFGLPHGGAIAGLLIGAIIILVGISMITGVEWEHFWPVVIIIFGILIAGGAVYGLTRR